MSATVKEILDEYGYLYSENSDWKSYFEDLADYGLPRKAWVITYRSKGERLKFNYLYDSTAIRGLQKMSAGFHSNITNSSIKWHGFECDNLDLMKDRQVQDFFYKCEAIQFRCYANSNFDNAMQEFYMDAGCFGTADIFTSADPKNIVRYTAIPIEQIELVQDANGVVIKVFRCFKLTAYQAFRKWGFDAGPSVRDALKDNKPNVKFEFIHYTGPRDVRDVSMMDNINMPWQSSWVSKKDKLEIHQSGYMNNPHAVGRFWKDPNDAFGFSPMMNILADTKLVNAQQRTALRGGMKAVDPAYSLPSRGYMLPLNFNPGATNYRDVKLNKDNRLELMPNGGSQGFQIGAEMIKANQMNIEDGLFLPLFQSLQNIGKNMKVLEVQKIIADNMALLGPVLGNFTHDAITPTVLNTFDHILKAGKFPPVPPQLRGQSFHPVYFGQLAKAQRQSEITDIDQLMQEMGEMANFIPEIADIPDPDYIAEKLRRFRNVDPKIFRDPQVIAARRQQKAQAIADQQKAQLLQRGAAAAKDMGQSHKAVAEATNASN